MVLTTTTLGICRGWFSISDQFWAVSVAQVGHTLVTCTDYHIQILALSPNLEMLMCRVSGLMGQKRLGVASNHGYIAALSLFCFGINCSDNTLK